MKNKLNVNVNVSVCVCVCVCTCGDELVYLTTSIYTCIKYQ